MKQSRRQPAGAGAMLVACRLAGLSALEVPLIPRLASVVDADGACLGAVGERVRTLNRELCDADHRQNDNFMVFEAFNGGNRVMLPAASN
jgi:hypothetical protein